MNDYNIQIKSKKIYENLKDKKLTFQFEGETLLFIALIKVGVCETIEEIFGEDTKTSQFFSIIKQIIFISFIFNICSFVFLIYLIFRG